MEATGPLMAPANLRDELVVIGAGRGAGDIVDLLETLAGVGQGPRLLGFLDDDAAKQRTMVAGHPVLGPVELAANLGPVRFVIAVAHYRRPRVRLEVAIRTGLPNERFATLVHPSASISPHASVGCGCIVFQGVVLGHGSRLGDHAFVGPGCLVSHHAVVEEGATMAPGSVLCGSSTLAAGAYLGARSVVRDGVTVGPGALVGLGSVVVRDVAEGRVVAGNPARVTPADGVA